MTWSSVSVRASTILVWMLAAFIADLMQVKFWGSVHLTMSLPVTLAAGMIFEPSIAGLVAFVGAFDRREFRGQVSVSRALYNRSQVAVSVMLASIVFHRLDFDLTSYPLVIGAALAALATDFVVNTALVVTLAGLLNGLTPHRTLAAVWGPSWVRTAGGYLGLGVMGLPLAAGVEAGGLWALVVFLAPIAVAHQMFLHGARLEVAARALDEKNRALLASVERAVDERRDERLVMAGELHDEVLPPLFKVHLMGQVLRQDIDSGRLLDLDEDLPELLSATEAAQTAMIEQQVNPEP